MDREESAFELWERFLSAGPASERIWLRRTLGRLLQLANYILIMATTIGALGVGLGGVALVFRFIFR